MIKRNKKGQFTKGSISWSKTNSNLMPRGERHHSYGNKKQLNTGRTHFKKGHIPWNRGLKMPNERSNNWKGGISKNKEYVRLRKQRYRHNNREKIYNLNREYFERRKKTKLTIKLIQMIYEDNIKKYGTLTCYLCLQPIAFTKDNLEHKIPLVRGGTNEYNNLGIACKKCNAKKYTKTLKEYMQEVSNEV